MRNYKIYYFHSLDLTFRSAQTIQIVKDYYYLSKLGVEVVIYGMYKDKKAFLEVIDYADDSKLKIIAKKYNLWNKIYLQIFFYISIFLDKSRKIIITRHFRKLSTALKLKKFGIKVKVLHEMHEESFPYLFKNIDKNYIKSLFLQKEIDCLIFTNYSQKIFFEKEFGVLPNKFIILPNGVEVDKFSQVEMKSNFVLTYVGQFNIWKNVELIFETLTLLGDKYKLRIAGGKGDHHSDVFIENLINKYKIDVSRVDYLGYIKNQDIPNLVLNESNVLLLPLGDNIQSRYLTSPMKLFEYMATKIPVLAINFPSVSLIVGDKIYLSKIDAKEFAQIISDICETSKKNFDFVPMNSLAIKYSYSERSLKFYKEVISEFS